VPLVDRRVVLHARVGAFPRGLGHLVEQRAPRRSFVGDCRRDRRNDDGPVENVRHEGSSVKRFRCAPQRFLEADAGHALHPQGAENHALGVRRDPGILAHLTHHERHRAPAIGHDELARRQRPDASERLAGAGEPQAQLAAAAEESEGALFQINLFWVIVSALNFILFFVIIWTFAFKPVSAMLAERKASPNQLAGWLDATR
jgi:hypothetical protein